MILKLPKLLKNNRNDISTAKTVKYNLSYTQKLCMFSSNFIFTRSADRAELILTMSSTFLKPYNVMKEKGIESLCGLCPVPFSSYDER